jgi:hypothetical protein
VRAANAVYRQPREEWMAQHPPGWLEYFDALGPRGTYGTWLRRKPIFTRVADTLFMHAGVNPTNSPPPRAEDADEQVRNEIRRFDRFRQRIADAGLATPYFTFDEVLQVAAAQVRLANERIETAKQANAQPDFTDLDVNLVRESADLIKMADWAVVAENGPMWYRGYAQAGEAELDAPLAAVLKRNDVVRLVVAHTPQRDGSIAERLGGRLFVIDTGMLTSVYKGRASALEIVGTRVTPLYANDSATK